MEKKEIRNLILNKRNNLKLKEKSLKDESIFKTLIENDLYKTSKNIFIFINYGSEVETKKIINKAIQEGKKIYVPKTIKENKEMRAIEIKSLKNLKEDKFGILEPENFEGEINKNELDLIIVPGAAFDRRGNRIGYGGGYYDRYFSDLEINIKKVALSYELQLVKNIVSEKYDIKVDFIITENEIINTNKKSCKKN